MFQNSVDFKLCLVGLARLADGARASFLLEVLIALAVVALVFAFFSAFLAFSAALCCFSSGFCFFVSLS